MVTTYEVPGEGSRPTLDMGGVVPQGKGDPGGRLYRPTEPRFAALGGSDDLDVVLLRG